MKVSIVTVVYNNAITIRKCIESVLKQTYTDIEYIIVDGASTDDTMKVIGEYETEISKIISEPDAGIYDAMNKGIKASSGSIIGILNSDDLFYDNWVIENVVAHFSKTNADVVYGNIIYFGFNEDTPVRIWNAGKFEDSSFFKGWHPPHPAMFVKKETYEKYGLYRQEFKIAADFELMLRLFQKCRVTSAYLNSYLVKMKAGGTSNRSIANILLGRREIIAAFKLNGFRVPQFYFISRYLSKILTQLKILK